MTLANETISSLSLSEQAELDQLEAVIRNGLNTFFDVGKSLLRIRDARLYRPAQTFEDYCRDRWGMARNYANKIIAAAEVMQNLGTTVPIAPSGERQTRPLTKLEPDDQPKVWQAAVETAPEGKVTAAHVERTVEAFQETGDVEKAKEKLAVHFSSESAKWNTPPEIVDRVVNTLGGIDLDPCSNSAESPNVPAANHFTADDDGLAKRWAGKVYMNPPYGREIVPWVEKLVEQYRGGEISEAIALVPARTDTEWCRMLREFPRCFISGRLNFSGHENSAPFPSMLVYLGNDVTKFAAAFADIGDTYVLMK
jgi:hypothetical protein